MKQDMILILDLGSEENPKIAREIRALGVYTEIHPHDITAEELAKLPGVKGIILNGGVNRVVDGVEIDASEAVYNAGLPILKADHKGGAAFPADDAERETVLKHFVFDTCKAEANWNMENFIADQIELIKRQVGDKKVLLALSGGVDSSVVAALLIRAIGKQLTCVHVNHGLLRKGEPEQVVQVFRDEMDANLIYVDAVDRFLDKVEQQLEQDAEQMEALRKQVADLTAENETLRRNMQSYEADGDMLKSALINAQRMGENVIREANQKAEDILHRANLRGDDIIRDANELLQKASDRADEIISEANDKKLAEEREYDRVRLEVTRFKSDVLNLYRTHVESLSRLPEFQQKEETSAQDAEAELPETEDADTTEEAAPAADAAETEDAAPEKAGEDFWEKDESQLKLDPPPADPNAVFQGVSFSE